MRWRSGWGGGGGEGARAIGAGGLDLVELAAKVAEEVVLLLADRLLHLASRRSCITLRLAWMHRCMSRSEGIASSPPVLSTCGAIVRRSGKGADCSGRTLSSPLTSGIGRPGIRSILE